MSIRDLLALSLTPGAGYVFINRLIAWSAQSGIPVADLIGGRPSTITRVLPANSTRWVALLAACSKSIQQRAERLLATADMAQVHTISVLDPSYPKQLKAALNYATPPILFLYGACQLLTRPMFGIVGSRWPSAAGSECARECASALARKGVPVVSGGAAGIDSCAHRAALTTGGYSVFILPQGLLTYTLPEAYSDAMAEKRVLLLSEFHPMAPWLTHAAVARNTTIAAFSRILCVIEARKKGGSIQTARVALELNRPLLYKAREGEAPLFSTHPLAQPLHETDKMSRHRQLEAAWRAAPASVTGQLDLL